ncbi:MAG: Clp protease N-terminal domain-containing protein, partial [Pseudomonadota bacterium]|nr:Clp protease N-terminal domain-containing protein [Pseudomonadota bacterium]
MDLENYTERSKSLIQAAQRTATRAGHQQLSPEHILKVLIEDVENLASNLIEDAGGNAKQIYQD